MMVGRIYRNTGPAGRGKQPDRTDLDIGSTEYRSSHISGTYRARKMRDKMSKVQNRAPRTTKMGNSRGPMKYGG